MTECQCPECLGDAKGTQLIESLRKTKKFCEEQILKQVLSYNFKTTDLNNLEYYRTKLMLINSVFQEVGITN